MTVPLTVANLCRAPRELPVPFNLEVRISFADGATAAGQVECTDVLRHLPGSRLVVRVVAAGGTYALKLFLGREAQRHYRRELAGLAALSGSQAGGARAAATLEMDDGAERAWGVLVPWIEGAEPLRDDDVAGVREVAAQVGRLHAQSYLRSDPHLNNYVRGSDGMIHALDGDGVRPCRWPVPGRYLANLGRQLAELPPAADRDMAQVCQAYCRARWDRDATPSLLARVRSHLRRQRRRRVRRFLAKTLRECSEFHCERASGSFVACARDAWRTEMQAFVVDPEVAFSGAEVIKSGNSATVARATLDGRPVVIKRYNVKSRWHGVRRSMRRLPRYRRAWCNGHRMVFLGLRTPRALALLEHRMGLFKTVAYLVMEDGGSRSLDVVVAEQGTSGSLVNGVVEALAGLRESGLVHGDTKASNFLLADGQICLIDLDAMTEGVHHERDLKRFLANWDALPEARARFVDALQAAGMGL